MKLKSVLLTAASLLFILISFGQNHGRLYKSGQWLDTKAKGFAKAYKDPTYEKVEILQTDKNFKVTLGSKILNYKIVSSNQFSEVKMDYTVTLDGKTFVLSISEQRPSTYSIGIDGEWMAYPVTNVSTVDLK